MKKIFLFLSFFILFIYFPKTVLASSDCSKIQFTEIMFDPEGSDTDHEWVEIFNTGTETIVLDSAWRFFDGSNHTISSSQSMELLPGEYAILADNVEFFHISYPNISEKVWKTIASLTNTGERIELKSADMTCDSVTYTVPENTESGKTLEKVEGSWKLSSSLGGSPLKNFSQQKDDSILEEETPIQTIVEVAPVISEAAKKTEWMDNNNILINEVFLSDKESWIELFNGSTKSIDIDAWKIRLGNHEYTISKKDIKNTIIEPLSYFVLEENISHLRPEKGEYNLIQLWNNSDEEVNKLSYDHTLFSQSFARFGKEWFWVDASPGKKNVFIKDSPISLETGIVDLILESTEAKDKLIINEIFPYPSTPDKDEWIEIKNISSSAIQLSDYALSDASKSGKKYFLPQQEILPGEFYLVYRADSHIQLNNSSDEVSLWYKESLLQKIAYYKAKKDFSYAWNEQEWLWQEEPSLGEENIFIEDTNSTTVSLIQEKDSDVQLSSLQNTLENNNSFFEFQITLAPNTLWKTKAYAKNQDGSFVLLTFPKNIDTSNILSGDILQVEGELQSSGNFKVLQILSQESSPLEYLEIHIDELDTQEAGTAVTVTGSVEAINKRSFTLRDDGENIAKISSKLLDFSQMKLTKNQVITVEGIIHSGGKGIELFVSDEKNIKKGTMVESTVLSKAENNTSQTSLNNLENNTQTLMSTKSDSYVLWYYLFGSVFLIVFALFLKKKYFPLL